MKHLLILLTLLCIGSAYQVQAAEELNYNLVDLSASGQRQVDNDVMVVVMAGSSEGNSAEEAAREVNSRMSWATGRLEDEEDIRMQTMNYQTRPVYKDQSVIGWSASQQLRLESPRFEVLSTIVGILQERLRVTSMHFGISPAKKQEITNGLITEALQAFTDKAELVSTSLGARDYRLVSLGIREDRPPTPRQGVYLAEAQVSAMQSRGPAVEAGESKLRVWVEGRIQLVF
jgi:predicted secreted protein